MDWLATEILTGFQKLLCLSLERTPAHNILPGTAQVWVETLSMRRAWDRERDTPRIRHAFLRLAAESRTWPLPGDLLNALPHVEAQRALPARPTDPEAALRHIAKAQELIAQRKPDEKRQRNLNPVGASLSELEAALRTHYATTKGKGDGTATDDVEGSADPAV